MSRVSPVNRWWPIAAGSAATLALALLGTSCSPTHAVKGEPPARPVTTTIPTNAKEKAMSTDQASRNIEHVRSDRFGQKVLRSELPVLVDFYADWCGPCRALAPVLEELAHENPAAKIVKVNVDKEPELAARYGIDSIPALLLFRDGQVAGQHVGLASKSSLQRLLSR